MVRYHAHGFVDGGYLRDRSREFKRPWVDPNLLLSVIVYDHKVQEWGRPPHVQSTPISLTRVTYYDALADDGSPDAEDLRGYLREIERLPDTELAFGLLRGRRQKGVDTQLAVDMVVGAFTGSFNVAVLVSGDADFVPAIQEVKRRGVMVVVAACEASPSLSDDLVGSADRFVPIGPDQNKFPPLQRKGGIWPRSGERTGSSGDARNRPMRDG